MEAFSAIHGFLATVRERLRRQALGVGSLVGAAALLLLLLLAPLLAMVAPASATVALRGGLWLVFLALVAAWIVLAIFLPRRRTAADRDMARFVGGREPHIASDLLSAVELEQALRGPATGLSRDLTFAFAADTAGRVQRLKPALLIPDRPMRQAGGLLAFAGLLHLAAYLAIPAVLGTGWARLAAASSSPADESAPLSVPEPLVGDLELSLKFPAHTGRAAVTLPAASGDLTAPKGTEISIVTTALRPTRAAALVFDGTPERKLAMRVDGNKLAASFVVDKAETYRFELAPETGRSLRETDARRLDVEADRPPRVDLFTPADDLEVSSRKRVELSWNVDDDYGLKEVALVWKVSSGREERKVLPLKPGRTTTGRLMWDLTEVPLSPGVRVPYHLEAKDNDSVSGPNIGRSRTFYLRIYSPRERHSELIERQQQLFERALASLADRLEVAPGTLKPHQELGRASQELVVELGQVAVLIDKDPLAPKKLKGELDAMRLRLGKLAEEEERLLADLDQRASKSPDRGIGARGAAQLGELDKKLVAELEKDVLLLDDWLSRQRLEEMLALADEIGQHRQKLAKLMEDYARTGSEKLREEIERELRALEQLERELGEKRARLGGEVADRFLNSDALQLDDAEDCLGKVRELVQKGDIEGSRKQLEKCSERMENASRAMEEGLRDLRGDKFSEEEKAFGELMDEVADLEQEEREIARELADLEDTYKKRAAEAVREKGNPARKDARKTVDRLRKELAAVPKDGLTPFGQEEHDALLRRIDDVGRMIDEGDVAEALSMAQEARASLGTLLGDIDDDMQDGEPWSDKTDEALLHANRAEPLVEQLIAELQQATPSAEEIMSREDKQKMDELARRQANLRERAKRTAQKAEKRGKELPQNAGQEAQRGLGEAQQKMEGAEKRMKQPDPQGARKEAEGAAEALGGLKKGLRQSARPTMVGNGSERDGDEVHIPGADEYKAPEEFREQILDAKRRGKAPADYQDQVDQYYKEITQ